MYANRCQIVLGENALEITRELINSNSTELIFWDSLTGVIPIFNANPPQEYRFDVMTVVRFMLEDGNFLDIELQEVTNQPSWSTGDTYGIKEAINDIKNIQNMKTTHVTDNSFDSLRLTREGVSESRGAIVTYAAAAVTAGQNIMANFFGVGFFGFLRSIQVTTNSTTPIAIQIAFYYQGHTTSAINAMISSTCPYKMENIWIPGFSSGSSTRAQIQVEFKEAIGSLTAKIAVGYDAVRLCNDLNLSAFHRILMISDSIGIGSLGGDYVDSDMYPWKVRNYFRGNGKDVRLIHKGYGGMTSTDVEVNRKYNAYDVDDPSLIMYAIGTNDTSGGFDSTKQSTYDANVRAFIAWKQLRYPRATLIMFGPSPAEDATREANMVLARGIVSAAVTAAADQKVLYVDLGAAFTATDTTKYNATEGAGTRVHLNTAGHSAVYGVIEPILDSVGI
jgi:lysophospholipase L1-like esterase